MATFRNLLTLIALLIVGCIVPSDLLAGLPCPCTEGFVCSEDNICIEEDSESSSPNRCWQNTSLCDWDLNFDFVESDASELLEGEGFSFSPDACHLYSTQEVDNQTRDDLFVSSREPGGAFSTPERIRHLSTSGPERRPAVTADRLQMYFLRRALPTESNVTHIYKSMRSSVELPWNAAVAVSGLNIDGVNNADLALSPNGLQLYFVRTADEKELYLSRRNGLFEEFSSAEKIEDLPGGKPSVFASGLRLGFISNDGQVSYATRDELSSPWVPQDVLSNFLQVAELEEFEVSPDGCEIIGLRSSGEVFRAEYQTQ